MKVERGRYEIMSRAVWIGLFKLIFGHKHL